MLNVTHTCCLLRPWMFSVAMTELSLILQNPEPLVTVYFLPLIFGFLILPEETPFAHPVDLEASLQDVGETILMCHLTSPS